MTANYKIYAENLEEKALEQFLSALDLIAISVFGLSYILDQGE